MAGSFSLMAASRSCRATTSSSRPSPTSGGGSAPPSLESTAPPPGDPGELRPPFRERPAPAARAGRALALLGVARGAFSRAARGFAGRLGPGGSRPRPTPRPRRRSRPAAALGLLRPSWPRPPAAPSEASRRRPKRRAEPAVELGLLLVGGRAPASPGIAALPPEGVFDPLALERSTASLGRALASRACSPFVAGVLDPVAADVLDCMAAARSSRSPAARLVARALAGGLRLAFSEGGVGVSAGCRGLRGLRRLRRGLGRWRSRWRSGSGRGRRLGRGGLGAGRQEEGQEDGPWGPALAHTCIFIVSKPGAEGGSQAGQSKFILVMTSPPEPLPLPSSASDSRVPPGW